MLRRTPADEIVNHGDEGVQALIGVLLGLRQFLQGDEGFIGLDCQFVNAVCQDYLSDEQALMLIVESDVILYQEIHQPFHPV